MTESPASASTEAATPDHFGSEHLAPYDAVVLMSFGGPEKPADVVPFLQNVTRGRGIPPERLAEVGRHYFEFGGRSPINDQCRALITALEGEFGRRGWTTPIHWGNRNWDPYLTDALREAAAAGHRRLLVLTTSAYPSYSSCRQYRENLYDATEALADSGITGLALDRVRQYATHPGFARAQARATIAALAALGPAGESARLVYVTHSIPTAMAETAGPEQTPEGGYVDWHRQVMAAVTAEVAARTGNDHDQDLVYCSRSGPASHPWLEPDVNDHLADLARAGVHDVVLIPIGFISDHMEVIYDLDTEAAATAAELGLGFARAATVGTDPDFVSALVDVLGERAAIARADAGTGRVTEIDESVPVVPGGGIGRLLCPRDCCPNLRTPEQGARCGSR
ncbi:MAG: ferrochelatase [Propionibacteriaceae bacterium]